MEYEWNGEHFNGNLRAISLSVNNLSIAAAVASSSALFFCVCANVSLQKKINCQSFHSQKSFIAPKKFVAERSTLILKLVNPTNWIIKLKKSTRVNCWIASTDIAFPSSKIVFIYSQLVFEMQRKKIYIAITNWHGMSKIMPGSWDDISSYHLFTFELSGTQYRLFCVSISFFFVLGKRHFFVHDFLRHDYLYL